MFCNVFRKWIIWIWSTQKCLNAQKYSTNLKSRTPLVFENIKTDPSKLINVRVVDFGEEPNLENSHWVLFRQKQFQLENTTYREKLCRTKNHHIKIPHIVF
nr:hypothetical protein BBBOND_0401070 [Ipomoea batatas]GME06379.1 hypothetical protein BBBOND_0401070 [Ipomoea batatas]